ncbi:hypothetical protein [Dyadobacter sediminis]|uniref:Uncharacterized protein n=1 Tax=Dyadobacter sediminis TaxID=1493691 RepID=A0A5R9KEX6_9BACT|nr:hypothetical protein [Dyadobacter sediminis]TLU94682.1 hypothetical protein FEM55_10680 [Dyadobacter sediminis]GGB89062.1 hypothetical protein GCM10011325_15720 [Dyadobacter sediminis]
MKRFITSIVMFTLIAGGTAMAQTTNNNAGGTKRTGKDSTQTQGNSSQGTSAWPQATGTAASTMSGDDGNAIGNTHQSHGTAKGDSVQTQGNSAQGTSAWPQATGTAASTTQAPESSSLNEATNGTMNKDSKKGKNRKNKGTAESTVPNK